MGTLVSIIYADDLGWGASWACSPGGKIHVGSSARRSIGGDAYPSSDIDIERIVVVHFQFGSGCCDPDPDILRQP